MISFQLSKLQQWDNSLYHAIKGCIEIQELFMPVAVACRSAMTLWLMIICKNLTPKIFLYTYYQQFLMSANITLTNICLAMNSHPGRPKHLRL